MAIGPYPAPRSRISPLEGGGGASRSKDSVPRSTPLEPNTPRSAWSSKARSRRCRKTDRGREGAAGDGSKYWFEPCLAKGGLFLGILIVCRPIGYCRVGFEPSPGESFANHPAACSPRASRRKAEV